jgi:hypothetical protein
MTMIIRPHFFASLKFGFGKEVDSGLVASFPFVEPLQFFQIFLHKGATERKMNS